ncbi:MAG: hypothetical protein LBM74_01490, partial [Oscillospiraceae bacterium]|nr:hypothetical protein [Oscillospiraceae bacterium]
MSIPAKKGLGNALWVLAALLLLSALIGYCTPIAQIDALEAEGKSSLLYPIGRFISGGSLYLLIGGLAVLAFRMFGLQFTYGPASAIKSWKTFFKAFPTTTFMIPGVLVMFFLSYLPMPGIVLAFKTYVRARRASVVESIARSQWVGLNNFDFISSGRVQAAIGNTFFFNLFWMVLGLVVSVALAIALSHLRNKRAVKFYQTGVFMPYFLSWVIASYLLFALISDERGLFRSVMIGMGVYTEETVPRLYQT